MAAAAEPWVDPEVGAEGQLAVDPEAEVPTDLEVDQVADPIPLAVEEVDPDIRPMIPATPDQEGKMTVLNFNGTVA